MQDLLVPGYLKSKLFSLTDSELIRSKFIKQYYLGSNKYPFEIVQNQVTREIAVQLGYHFCNLLNKDLLADASSLEFGKKLVRLGTKYGGWFIFPEMLSSSSIVYSVGAGNDISFDLELIAKFGCGVFCFDPTPLAIEHVFNTARQNEKLFFYPYGVFSRDAVLDFYRPRNPQHGSLSATNIRQTEWSIQAPVRRLRSIMEELEHDRLDLLKIDIEGAEYDVIEDILFERLDIKQISVEFDQPVPPWRTEKCIKSMLANKYTLVKIDSLNFTFIKTDVLKKYTANE